MMNTEGEVAPLSPIGMYAKHTKEAWLPNEKQKDITGMAPVVQKADNSIHRTNYYPVDSVLCFGIIYSLDSDLSSG